MGSERIDDSNSLFSRSQKYLYSIISFVLATIISTLTESFISELLTSRVFLRYSLIGIVSGIVVGILIGFTIVKIAIRLEASSMLSGLRSIPIIGQHIVTLVLILAIPALILIRFTVLTEGGGGCPPDPNVGCAPPRQSEFSLVLPFVAFLSTLLLLRLHTK